jgi:hypothetical protein
MQAWAVHSPSILWAVALTGVVLGVLGCSFGLWTWQRQQSLQRRLVRLQELAASEQERQTKRAKLHAALEQHVEISWTLVIQNEGPATASGITLSLNGVPLDQSPLIDPRTCGEADTESLAGNRQLRLPLVVRERPEDLVVEVTWSDASGDLGFSKRNFAA